MSTVPFADVRAGSPPGSARFFRRMRNACAVPTRLAAYLVLWAWLAGRIVAMSSITIGLGFSGAMAQSGGTAPAVSGHVATVTGPDVSDTVFDSGFFRVGGDANAASVPLMGTTDAADGASIEVRWVEFNDATDVATGAVGGWQSAGTASGGAWGGTLTAPRNIYSYYRPEVRVVGSTAAPTMGPSKFVVGHVFSIWGQSNTIRPLGAFQGEQTPPDPVTDPRALRVWISDRTQSPHVPELFFVNDANAGFTNEPIRAPQVLMSNLLAQARPGERFVYASQIQSGADATVVQNDANTDWLWSDVVILNNALTGNGVSRVGFSVSASWSGLSIAMVTGKDSDGTPVARGGTDEEGSTVNYFWSDLFGDDGYTRVATLSSSSELTPKRQDLLSLIGNPLFPEVLPFDQWTYGSASDGHLLTTFPDSLYGSMRQSAVLMMEILIRTGMVTNYVVPEITNWDYTSETHVDVWNPNYDITTWAEILGDTIPGVRGFHLNGQLLTGTEAQIVANAGGSGRRGVRITPPSGIVGSGDLATFGTTNEVGQTDPASLTLAERNADRLANAKGLPVIRTAGPNYPAMPITPRVTLTNNLPQPLFFTTADPQPAIVDPSSLGSGNSALTVQTLIRLRSDGGTTGGPLIDQAARGSFALNTGNLNWKTGGAGATSIVSNWSPTSGASLTGTGVWTTITMSIDMTPTGEFPNGVARIWSEKDGSALEAYEIGLLPNSGTFDGSRALRVMSMNAMDVQFFRIWKAGTATTDTSALGTPYKAFTSDADGNMVQTPLLPSW